RRDSNFGRAIAIDGTTIVVGAPGDDSLAENSGQVYVFDVAGEQAEITHILENPIPRQADRFGTVVATDEGTLAIASMHSGVHVYDVTGERVNHVSTLVSPSERNHNFGHSISVDRSTIAVGESTFGSFEGRRVGRAYLYKRVADDTELVSTLENPAPKPSDQFGVSVALEGNRLIVGQCGRFIVAGDPNTASGAVFVYSLQGNEPILTSSISNPDADNWFGSTVDIAGQQVIAGMAPVLGEESFPGAALVFNLNNNSPVHIATLSQPTPLQFHGFGASISATDEAFAVGAPGHAPEGDHGIGAVFYYELIDSVAELKFQIPNPLSHPDDRFGAALAMDNSFLVVGSPGRNRRFDQAFDSGLIHVFDVSTEEPTPIASIENPDPVLRDYFGATVAISGNTVVIGAPGDSRQSSQNFGKAYVFQITDGGVLQIAKIENPTPQNTDRFGSAIAIDGDTIVIGDTHSKSVFVYRLVNETVQAITTISQDWPISGFGESVEIRDGRVVVGAPEERTDNGGNGTVRIYELINDAAVLREAITSPMHGGNPPKFGTTLSLDGDTLVVGTDNGSPSSDYSTAYVYNLNRTKATLQGELELPAFSQRDDVNSAIAAVVVNSTVLVGSANGDTQNQDQGRVDLYQLSPPSAEAAGPYVVPEGDAFRLDASKSTDSEGNSDSLLYEWDIDYDAVDFNVDVVGERPSLSFGDDFDNRQIGLRVTDSEGETDIDTTTISIKNVPPI
ncbi:hypothetical protein ACFL2H_13870, partial [Planctomycetota bacterium]